MLFIVAQSCWFRRKFTAQQFSKLVYTYIQSVTLWACTYFFHDSNKTGQCQRMSTHKHDTSIINCQHEHENFSKLSSFHFFNWRTTFRAEAAHLSRQVKYFMNLHGVARGRQTCMLIKFHAYTHLSNEGCSTAVCFFKALIFVIMEIYKNLCSHLKFRTTGIREIHWSNQNMMNCMLSHMRVIAILQHCGNTSAFKKYHAHKQII